LGVGALVVPRPEGRGNVFGLVAAPVHPGESGHPAPAHSEECGYQPVSMPIVIIRSGFVVVFLVESRARICSRRLSVCVGLFVQAEEHVYPASAHSEECGYKGWKREDYFGVLRRVTWWAKARLDLGVLVVPRPEGRGNVFGLVAAPVHPGESGHPAPAHSEECGYKVWMLRVNQPLCDSDNASNHQP